MRKLVSLVFLLGLLGLLASPLYAGGIINKQNQSADYFRTLARNAATDYVDITVYNPAGVMQMDNGGYAKLDVQYVDKEYSNTFSGGALGASVGEVTQDKPSLIPGLFTLYKKDKWAGFFAVTYVGGGGEVEWDQGSATSVLAALAFYPALGLPNDTLVNAKSIYYGYTFGGSYALNDTLSFAAGLRYVDANVEGEIKFNKSVAPIVVDFDQDAEGWGAFVGLNWTPTDKLNFGLTYYTETELDFDLKINRDDTGGLAAGLLKDNFKEDLPGLLLFGASYRFTDALKLDFNVTYYFEKAATWQSDFAGAGDTYDIALSAEYRFNPKWKVSAGYMYTDVGIDADQQLPEEPKLSASTLAAGVVWSAIEQLDITLGGVLIIYDDVTDDSISSLTGSKINYDKEIWFVAVGVQWKFM